MTPKESLWGAFGVCATVVLASFPLMAQTPSGTIEPQVVGIGADISLGDERLIGIHRQARGGVGNSSTIYYFHRPLFLIETTKSPPPGYPDIVHDAETFGEFTYLTFKFILSTPKFREDARGFIINNDPELKAPGAVDVNLNEIRVLTWPMVEATVAVTTLPDSSLLATWASKPLMAAGPILSVPIGFSEQTLSRFLERAAAGKIQFEFSYSFRNVRQQYGRRLGLRPNRSQRRLKTS